MSKSLQIRGVRKRKHERPKFSWHSDALENESTLVVAYELYDECLSEENNKEDEDFRDVLL